MTFYDLERQDLVALYVSGTEFYQKIPADVTHSRLLMGILPAAVRKSVLHLDVALLQHSFGIKEFDLFRAEWLYCSVFMMAFQAQTTSVMLSILSL